MLLLSTDTSGKHGSIALARGRDDGSCDVIEVVPLAGGTFSAQLVPQVAALLAKHDLQKRDIGAFVVASGPGSFTGLRVGLAAIKALAEILGKPIAAVSLLEAVARTSGSQGSVMAILDAGRGEVYVGRYQIASDSAQLIGERILRTEELAVETEGSMIVTPDNTVAEAAQEAGLTISTIASVDAGTIAELGWRRIKVGQTISPEELEANYIRRSDAEIFAKGSY